MIQLPKGQFGTMAALTAITAHLDKQIEKATPKLVPLVQECVIEVTRYGGNGEPLTVKVLGSAKHTKESRVWTACPEAEVVETVGDFHAGEVLSLFPEEQVEVATQAEREWLND